MYEITSPKIRTIKTLIEDKLVQINSMVMTECVVLICGCALLRSIFWLWSCVQHLQRYFLTEHWRWMIASLPHQPIYTNLYDVPFACPCHDFFSIQAVPAEYESVNPGRRVCFQQHNVNSHKCLHIVIFCTDHVFLTLFI